MRAIANDNTTLFNSKPLDNDAQRAALARELRVAKGFTLIFALCNSAAERARQVTALREELSDLKLQEISIRTKIPHLLNVLRTTLDDPLPDAVFVYGMENWIRSDTNPHSIPFLLNLNAARNHFIQDCPCPLVMWIPDYLVRQIIKGAPDFASVRSGLYVFTTSPSEAREVIDTLKILGLTEASGLLFDEKQQRLKEFQDLLARVQNLPQEIRNEQDELSVLSQLSTMYYLMGRYAEVEPLLQKALEIIRHTLPTGHPNIAASLNNLALLYRRQGRYAEAEPLLQEALRIRQNALGTDHPDYAVELNNLARLYEAQGRYAEAEPLFIEALDIFTRTLGLEHPDTRMVTENLEKFIQERNK